MKRHIFNKLNDIKNENYPFHMPGHKRNEKFLQDFYNFISLDFTEIDETDNMHNPDGIIKKSMEEIAKVFSSDYSYFLVNGSSCGIMASIMATVSNNDKILVARNCHISVYNGILLSGAFPIYISPTTKYNIPCSIDIEKLKNAIKKYDNIKALILTSPTYEGFVCDIKKISKILKEKNIILIVDEAHGAHFNFSDNFPTSAIKCGADIVIQSFHKTLPSLTQCAMLHFKKRLVNKDKLENCLSITQTTSPSYIFMMSLEYCAHFCNENKTLFDDYTNFLLEIRKQFCSLKNIKLIDNDILENKTIIDFDISRFTFLINSNINGNKINKMLKENNIQVEMYSKNHIICISTICDDYKSLKKLKDVLFKIDSNLVYEEKTYNELESDIIIPIISPRKAFYKQKHLINLNESEGLLCGDFVTPYPPGIPILAPGELITKDIIYKINNYIENNIKVLGIKENKIYVLDKKALDN